MPKNPTAQAMALLRWKKLTPNGKRKHIALMNDARKEKRDKIKGLAK